MGIAMGGNWNGNYFSEINGNWTIAWDFPTLGIGMETNSCVPKNAPTFASCSFDKHGLILIFFVKSISTLLKVCWCCRLKIKISPSLSKLQLAKVGAFFWYTVLLRLTTLCTRNGSQNSIGIAAHSGSKVSRSSHLRSKMDWNPVGLEWTIK